MTNIDEIKANIAGKITLATSQILNHPEQSKDTIEFLDSIINLLESINNKKIDISEATKKIEEINKTLNDTKKESISDNLDNNASISMEQDSPISKENNNEYVSDTLVSPKQDIEIDNTKKTVTSQENEIEWKNKDFFAHFYGRSSLESFFASSNSNWSDIKNNKISIQQGLFKLDSNYKNGCNTLLCYYDSYDKKYILIYTPSKGFEDIKQHPNDASNRGQAPYLVLTLSIEEIKTLALNEDTEIFLETNKNLRDEINYINYYDRKSEVSDMPKIKIPFYNTKKVANEFDVEFFNIFIDYMSNKDFSKYDNENTNIPIFNNSNNKDKTLNMQDMFKIITALEPFDIKPVFLFNESTSTYAPLFDPWENAFEKFMIFSHVFPEKMRNSSSNTKMYFDIKDGISSQENIIKLYNYIQKNPSIIKKEAWVKREEEYYEKHGEYYSYSPKTTIQKYKEFFQVRDDLLTRLKKLYDRKFGDSYEQDGIVVTESNRGRSGR